MGYDMNPDNSLLDFKVPKDYQFNAGSELVEDYTLGQSCLISARTQKYFEDVENAAS